MTDHLKTIRELLPAASLGSVAAYIAVKAELDALEADRKMLREALERIESMCAAPPNFSDATIQEVARAALERPHD